MRRIVFLAFLSLLFLSQNLSYAGNVSNIIDQVLGSPQSEETKDIIYQVSSYNLFNNGEEEGIENIQRLKNTKGDLGYGYVQDNKSVIIVFGEDAYRADDTYSTRKIEKHEYHKIAYGTFKFFDPDETFSIKSINSTDELTKFLDSKMSNKNYFNAIKINGSFSNLFLYDEKIGGEPLELRNKKGTIIAFRMPEMYDNILSKIDYYFISDDLRFAGKIDKINIKIGKVYVDTSYELSFVLPQTKAFKKKEITDYTPYKKEKEDKEATKQVNSDTQNRNNKSSSSGEPVMDMSDYIPRLSF